MDASVWRDHSADLRMDYISDTSFSSQSYSSSSMLSTPSPVKQCTPSPQVMPKSPVDDLLGDVAGLDKEKVQQALMQLMKTNPDLWESARKESQSGSLSAEESCCQSTSKEQFPNESTGIPRVDLGLKEQGTFPEMRCQLNQPYISKLERSTDSDDGKDSLEDNRTPHGPFYASPDSWLYDLAPQRGMTPRQVNQWRRALFSVFMGHLPRDISRKEVFHLFSEAGKVLDLHLQPAGDSMSYIYGFVRYGTLEEATKAVSEFNGKVLGNRGITVELASETRRKLAGLSEDEDGPLAGRDKLIKNDFARLGRRQLISPEETEAKLVEWKLRQSAMRPKSPHAAFVKDYMDNYSNSPKSEDHDELMEKIELIVKKLVDVPGETMASPSGEEGPEFSPKLLQHNPSVVTRRPPADPPSRAPLNGAPSAADQTLSSLAAGRRPQTILNDGNPQLQETRPASMPTNRFPASVLNGGNSATQERSQVIPPNGQAASNLHEGNSLKCEEKQTLVTPVQLPSHILLGEKAGSQPPVGPGVIHQGILAQRREPENPPRATVLQSETSVSPKQAMITSRPLFSTSGQQSASFAGNAVSDPLPARRPPEQLPSDVLRAGSTVTQERNPLMASPGRATTDMPLSGNPPTQGGFPADRVPPIAVRGVNPTTQDQTQVMVPSNAPLIGNPATQRHTSVGMSTPDRPAYVERGCDPVAQVQACASPDQRPAVGSADGNPVSPDRQISDSPCGPMERKPEVSAARLAPNGLRGNSAAQEPGQISSGPLQSSLVFGGDPSRGAESTNGLPPTSLAVPTPSHQGAVNSCGPVPTAFPVNPAPRALLPTPVSGHLPLMNQFQGPFRSPLRALYPTQQLLRNQMFVGGFGRGRACHQPFYPPAPRRFGHPGAFHPLPHFQHPRYGPAPSRFPPVGQAGEAAARGCLGDPQSRPLNEAGGTTRSDQTPCLARGDASAKARSPGAESAPQQSDYALNECGGLPVSGSTESAQPETTKPETTATRSNCEANTPRVHDGESDDKSQSSRTTRREPESLVGEVAPAGMAGPANQRLHETSGAAATAAASSAGDTSAASKIEGSNSTAANRAKSTSSGPKSQTENLRLLLCGQDSGIATPEAEPCSLERKRASLLQLKMELQSVSAENEKLRVELGGHKQLSRKAPGMYSHEAINALEEEIHAKEIQMQRQKEIICARFSEQELLYEREKLEVAFDPAMAKELETERVMGKTRDDLTMAQFEQELLLLYRKLVSLA